MKNKSGLVTIFFIAVAVVLIDAQCPNSIGGMSYPNLPKLTNSGPSQGDWTLTGTDGNLYNWNICAQQNSCSLCSLPDTVVCQNCQELPKSCGVLSSQSIQVVPGINSVNFIYGQGTFSNACGANRNSNISVACSSSPGTVIVSVVPNNSCSYSILMTSSYACPGSLDSNPVVPDQALALTDMQKKWGADLGWVGDAATHGCQWNGVSCKQVGIYSAITAIDVSNNGLQGAIPDSIGDLSSLTAFNCSNNPLIGGTIPASLGTIKSLATVDLSSAGLSGTLPSNLVTVNTLLLTANKLTGTVPSLICNVPFYNLQGNLWTCPLPSCCSSAGNYLCVPCISSFDGSLQVQ